LHEIDRKFLLVQGGTAWINALVQGVLGLIWVNVRGKWQPHISKGD
jgi:hypothetical protein